MEDDDIAENRLLEKVDLMKHDVRVQHKVLLAVELWIKGRAVEVR